MEQVPELYFLDKPELLRLYQALESAVLSRYPQCVVKVQKTDISFSAPRPFLYVWLPAFRKRISGRPGDYLILTLLLNHPVYSPRIVSRTEPYPGRFTHHLTLSSQEELDGTFFSWLEESWVYRCLGQKLSKA